MSDNSVKFGRDICSDITQSTQREWLITNGIGGYGCGTLSGILTRCYHGLLIAALKPPLGRMLLLTKLDEVVQYQNQPYPLSSDRYSGGTTTGHGYKNTERFCLEGTTPTWTYACADALLEKRIWMQQGENTTYIRYTLRRATCPLKITIKAIVNYRDHHGVTKSVTEGKEWKIKTQAHPRGLKILAFDEATPFYLCTSKGQLMPVHEWYQNYFLTTEQYRGLAHLEDHLYAAKLTTTLSPGESITITASTLPTTELNGTKAIAEKEQYEQALLSSSPFQAPVLQQLVLAADQFIVDRTTPETPNGKTIIAGYPWFGDWGRDTMIALPGLTITTGRAQIARPILRTFARYLSQGMLPNAFPEANDTPGYNTVDAILWYFEAVRAYLEATSTEATEDLALLEELYPKLQEVIDWHERGTRYNIHLDPSDGLIYAGEAGAQLTWMDAKVGDWVVTPRVGKPVEINALWCNALTCMADFSDRLNQPKDKYLALLENARAGFERFWLPDQGYLADVLDGSNGNDTALRPNQLFAVSLSTSLSTDALLSPAQQKSIVDACAQHLLTSHGLRSLSPTHPDYIGTYGGDRTQRDGSYHQGTVWGWLIGPFVQAHLKVYKDPAIARTFLQPLLNQIESGCVGTLSEIFDGNVPFAPRGAYAQAWSVAEVLRLASIIEEAEKT